MVAYVVAFVLANFVTAVVVLAVAWSRTHGRVDDLPEAASRFALSAAGIVTQALISATVLAIMALSSAGVRTGNVSAALRLGRTSASLVGLVSAVLGMVSLSLAVGAAIDLLGWREHSAMAAAARALQRPGPLRLLLAIVAIAIAPALAEEGFFRGLIQTRLAARWGKWPSIIATAIGFGLFHADPAQGSAAVVAGLFLGWVTETFNGIRPAILAHGFNNAAFVVIASFESATDGHRSDTLWVLATGSVVCIGTIALLRSQISLSPPARQNT